MLWAEFVWEHVVRQVPHRHFVFALPKALRPAFRYRRSLLPKLALSAWNTIAAHIRADTGAFTSDGDFLHTLVTEVAALRELFQAHVLRLLLKEQLVSPELVDRMRTWRHSGFHAFAGNEIPDVDDAVRVGLYMMRSPAATSRLQADPHQEVKLRYLAKGTGHDHGNAAEPVFHRDFDYLDWIARLTSHIPEKGVQLVHYYGAYSNAHRGKALRRQAFTLPNPETPSTPPEQNPGWLKERRKSWARLIRRVYEVDPLLCRCGERMRVVGFITQAPVIPRSLPTSGGASNR